jgi:hypothetical protein
MGDWKERLGWRGLIIIIIIMYVWATIYAFRFTSVLNSNASAPSSPSLPKEKKF